LYSLGDFVTPSTSNNFIYRALDFIQLSGNVEPSWIYTTDTLIQDNGITWKCLPTYGLVPATWFPSRDYKVGDLVKSTSTTTASLGYMFECISIQKTSGSSTPSFSTILGEFTEDGSIIWVCKKQVVADLVWTANTVYELGSSVKNGSFSYESVGFKGNSNTTEPIWKTTDNYPISAIDTVNKKFSILGNVSSFYLVNDSIRIQGSNGNDGYYTVSNTVFDGTNTNITVVQPITNSTVQGNIFMQDSYVRDSGILWKMYPVDTTIFDYDWNEYLIITNTIYLH
jgi:hypothetical protein